MGNRRSRRPSGVYTLYKLTISYDWNTVYEHKLDPFGISQEFLVRGFVDHAVRIEHGNIPPGSGRSRFLLRGSQDRMPMTRIMPLIPVSRRTTNPSFVNRSTTHSGRSRSLR